MIEANLDTANGVLYVRPKGKLEEADFARLAKTADPFIESSGGLRGLVIEAQAFPGWDSFGALLAHLRFIRDHHKHIRKLAVVTDSPMGEVAEKLASHFVAAQIRHFASGEMDAARKWILA
jgi:hypothetical protein